MSSHLKVNSKVLTTGSVDLISHYSPCSSPTNPSTAATPVSLQFLQLTKQAATSGLYTFCTYAWTALLPENHRIASLPPCVLCPNVIFSERPSMIILHKYIEIPHPTPVHTVTLSATSCFILP